MFFFGAKGHAKNKEGAQMLQVPEARKKESDAMAPTGSLTSTACPMGQTNSVSTLPRQTSMVASDHTSAVCVATKDSLPMMGMASMASINENEAEDMLLQDCNDESAVEKQLYRPGAIDEAALEESRGGFHPCSECLDFVLTLDGIGDAAMGEVRVKDGDDNWELCVVAEMGAPSCVRTRRVLDDDDDFSMHEAGSLSARAEGLAAAPRAPSLVDAAEVPLVGMPGRALRRRRFVNEQ